MTATTVKTDLYLSEVCFHPFEIVEESFWNRVPEKYLCDQQKLFYIQYLHDTPSLDRQLINKINMLFLHAYFPQEDSLEEFRNDYARRCGCYVMSKLIVEYAKKTFSELNLNLLGNVHRLGLAHRDYPEEIKSDPLKSKYMRYISGMPHVLANGSYSGKSVAFDCLGIDFLSDASAKPLAQAFIASDNTALNDILTHRYMTQEGWYQFQPEDSFIQAIFGKKGTLLSMSNLNSETNSKDHV
jgi:hypothetical protein